MQTVEELWAGSVRRYHERRRQQNAAAWFEYFCRMADNHRALSEDYQRRAEELCQDPPHLRAREDGGARLTSLSSATGESEM